MTTAATLLYEPRPAEPERRYKIHEDAEDATTSEYAPLAEFQERFYEHFRKLNDVAVNRSLWVEGAEPPSAASVDYARIILKILKDTEMPPPTRVVASAEGGVALCFISANRYADIECLNTGEILAVTSNRRDRPVVWAVDPDPSGISQTTVRIRKFIG